MALESQKARLRWRWAILAFGILFGAAVCGAEEASPPVLTQVQSDFFETKVRPVLADQCYDCHSAKAEKLKGSLYLDSKDGVAKGGVSGPVLIPGRPDDSLLIQVVRGTAHDVDRMPPEKAKRSALKAEQIAALEEWVRMGAPDPRVASGPVGPSAQAKTHWAFQKPVAPKNPAVKSKDWPREDLDYFILAKLEAEGLHPSPEADRHSLLRRASFDLTGLPPTADEMSAFIADPSPQAYENAVDRLLASPRYGERWARHWLDVARYADTKGYVFEEERRYGYSYTYRDWVIEALNRDLPYDRFLIEQIAGDQVTDDGKQSAAALGFLTLGRRFLNNQPDIIDDRLDVVFRGTQALTVGCARCHDHKFDPIPTADYYSLYGVFASCNEPGDKPLLGENPDTAAVADYEKERAKREKELADFRAQRTDDVLHKLRERVGDYLLTAQESLGLDWTNLEGLSRTRSLDPGLVGAWKEKLEHWRGAHHPVFGVWFDLAADTNGDFAAKVVAACDRASSKTNGYKANGVILAKLREKPPENLKEAAEVYARAILEADKQWQKIESDAKEGKASKLSALPDPDQEALRSIIYAEDSPVKVAMRDIDRFFDTPTGQKVRGLKRAIDELDATHPGAPPRAMVLLDNAQPTEPVVFKRGNPGNHGPSVPRQFLGILAGEKRKPFSHGSGRLEMAEAIASKDNPLTARVFVNRVWIQYMGSPLVRTPSDFGLRSDPPANPQLLDHLAVWLMDHDWSMKSLHRYIVLSAAYRQSSDPEAAGAPVAGVKNAEKVDPQNGLFWRMNKKRLDFEAMRDALLQVSGQLDLTFGGHAVEMFSDKMSDRRTIYGFVDRQNLPGLLRAFDFASPDASSPMRFQTTVPQQALFLMNGPFTVAAARKFAELESEDSRSDLARIIKIYNSAYQRWPTPVELTASLHFLKAERARPAYSPPKPAWEYGTGEYDEASGCVKDFKPFKYFSSKDQRWQDSEVFPIKGARGYASLGAKTGHPGRTQSTAVVRRWTSTVDGTVKIRGELSHDEESGDGVRARVVSDRGGKLGEWTAHKEKTKTKVDSYEIRKGEVLDFIVDCRTGDNSDSFGWDPSISVSAGAAADGKSWTASKDFRDPNTIPVPLDPWGKLAQVILASNEFVFED